MARTSSANKAQRVALRRRVFNLRRKSTMKETLKKLSKQIEAKNASEAGAMFPAFQKAIDKAAKSGVIKKNTAARLKSRTEKRLRALAE